MPDTPWLSVHDPRPVMGLVFVLTRSGNVFPARKIVFDARGRHEVRWGGPWLDLPEHEVTHWMPMPEQLKEN